MLALEKEKQEGENRVTTSTRSHWAAGLKATAPCTSPVACSLIKETQSWFNQL